MHRSSALNASKLGGIHHKSTLVYDEGGEATEVLCEVKEYGSDRLEDSIRLELHRRREAMAELQQEVGAGCSNGFRVFRCLGYFHDSAKLFCGLVYSLPTLTASDHLDIPTLRTVLIMNDERTGKQKGKSLVLLSS